ncbi:MAG: hypothetical protein H6581_24455 [Bacteroidia bacterium]|nr:hypothetical protein [Bacteroidia bacterium]
MKNFNFTFFVALMIALMAYGCNPMDENPLQETNSLEVQTAEAELNAIIENHNQETAKPTYTPGQVHIPVAGCDTLTTDLVIPYGDQSAIKIGEVYITLTNSDLYFTVDPYAGIKVVKVSFAEDAVREGIALDKDGTPDHDNFEYQESFANGKPRHTFGVTLEKINQCQAYCLYIQLATFNGPGGAPKYWDAWAWGHDVGDGYIMELCVPECGAGSIFQN